MGKIKGDTFVDVYLIGSIKSYNIRVDHRDKVLSLKKSASNIDDYALLMDTYLIAAGGRFSIEASKILKKIKNKYPSNENTYFFRALEHLEKKEYQPAIKMYEKLKTQNILKTEKLILLENKLKIIGYSN